MRTSNIESLAKKSPSSESFPVGDIREEMRNPRKSKLQSTFLPSPNQLAEIAVGTGPSLMATIQNESSIEVGELLCVPRFADGS